MIEVILTLTNKMIIIIIKITTNIVVYKYTLDNLHFELNQIHLLHIIYYYPLSV